MERGDQASGLRKKLSLRQKGEARSRRIIAVTSGKGGAGKTLIAVNLALSLREMGRRVLLVDLDPGMADADVLLGVHPPVTLEECIQKGRPVSDAVMVGPKGLLLLPGASGLESLASPGSFEKIGLWPALEKLKNLADVIILDTGAGISKAVLDPLSKAGLILLVTNPEPAALTDSYALLKLLHLRKRSERVGLVVNKARHREDALITATRLRKVSNRFLGQRPELLGWLPESAVVASSARERRPFFTSEPGTGLAKEMRSLAARSIEALAGKGLEGKAEA